MAGIEAATEPRLMNDMDGALERADTLLTLLIGIQDGLEPPSPTTEATGTQSPTANNLTSKMDALNNTLQIAIDRARESKALLG